ncbi:hypothetical protein QKT49_gp450 [Acanthamoeba castellanii medusavirus]|uniref:Uncharacterized protein n=1 Tax=Acanthamoeba castellanii medusavirus J1 TaxID=3114988 RepID=A0A3T1CWV5_9VIRU|nr:hypothetical protein QKT49_gp450 [Acanthamoeba castellanii medusavirus]BBI30313.1 hypothetical protein [Acanthamoeba castellanii medusavirus J1]
MGNFEWQKKEAGDSIGYYEAVFLMEDDGEASPCQVCGALCNEYFDVKVFWNVRHRTAGCRHDRVPRVCAHCLREFVDTQR